MQNDRLRRRLVIRRMAPNELASAVEVDPKTVDRWLSEGRLPRARQRERVARVLDVEESFLWPQLSNGGLDYAVHNPEVVGVYPTRGTVPPDLWRELIEGARKHLEVLVYSGLFLVDSYPDLPRMLIERTGEGLEARLLYGDPDSETVTWRGREEGIGENLAARIRLSLTYMAAVRDIDGLEVRQHDTVLYNSIYRFDDEMLVNTHVVGSPAPTNPVLHLRRAEGEQMFGHYLQSFDRVWAEARPVTWE